MANGKVEIAWGDGDHVFNIAPIAQTLELEQKCGCGVAEIFERLKTGRWWMSDIRETLRLGLIGGGMEPPKALVLIKRYVDGRPWIESVQPATVVIMAAMVGVPGDEVGKKPEAEGAAAKGNPSTATMEDSSAPQSTGSAQPSVGIHEPSMA